ncbi:MAG: tetratricopeptide repeat protein [Paludibacteraceae bacterium]|nr:tetratricopeptide repeat protein [Paludibacteraceae bacterium]
MERKIVFLLVSGLIVLMASGCSTQKNTAANRSFHQTKVKYNIFYNGNIAFQEGQQATIKAHEDDFTTVIPLYPVSDHKAAEASTSQMDKMIEKCRKCIKLHSIKAKPKPDPKKRQDPKYKKWLEQEEFNNQMDKVWIRLGESEFSKGDFLGSIGTFTYIIKHYDYDPDVVAQSQLWMARAYAELGWQYEAEDLINKVNVDALSRKHSSQYASAKADVLLKGKQYHEAIPFIKLALPDQKRNFYKPRFQFVLGQIYQLEGRNKEAVDAYKKCIKMIPPQDMEFQAQINKAILQGKSSIRSLQKMAKLSKYKDQLDNIYGAIGDIYLANGDTAKAVESYQTGIDKATQTGSAKAAILIKAGDIYYMQRNYEKAQPCYQEAMSIISAEHEDYARLRKLSSTLDALIAEYNVVVLQDSLQALAKLSPEEQRKVAEKIVADLIEAEKKAEEEALIAQREAENSGLQSVDTRNMLGGPGGAAADWYFYNEQLIRSGKQQFTKKWGNRPLEDNWRRISKAVMASFMSDTNEDDLTNSNDSISTDSIGQNGSKIETDNHKPEFYLQQIPKTEEDFAISDSLIANALFNLIFIYQDEIGDQELADESFAEFQRRFPNDPRIAEINNQRNPDPEYIAKLRRMLAEQDSIYELTYNAYKKSEFATVKTNKVYAEETFPMSPLMPRFLFLNAVAVARTDGQDAFVVALKDMVTRYPENELSAMAKDMLAMMGQGMESQTGELKSDLEQMRAESEEETAPTDETVAFSTNRNTQSLILLALPEADETKLNKLLYEVALFNFSQFLIRDFDLQKMPVWADGCALRISGFESLDETTWYLSLVAKNEELSRFIGKEHITSLCITEENYQLIPSKLSLEDYNIFINK